VRRNWQNIEHFPLACILTSLQHCTTVRVANPVLNHRPARASQTRVPRQASHETAEHCPRAAAPAQSPATYAQSHICAYTRTHAQTHTRTHARTHAHTHARTHMSGQPRGRRDREPERFTRGAWHDLVTRQSVTITPPRDSHPARARTRCARMGPCGVSCTAIVMHASRRPGSRSASRPSSW
jgi:hypothetical protein